MIQVTAVEKYTHDDPSMTLWRARAPMLLPIFGVDEDPLALPVGWTLAINQEALDESPSLAGAIMALISIGALVEVRAVGSVN